MTSRRPLRASLRRLAGRLRRGLLALGLGLAVTGSSGVALATTDDPSGSGTGAWSCPARSPVPSSGAPTGCRGAPRSSVQVAAVLTRRAGGPWGWPLAGRPPVLRRFDPPASPYGPGHRGVDLGGAPGDLVLAAGPGVVGYAGVLAGRGVVSVQHPSGLRSTYEPLAVAVERGETVSRGTVLGRLLGGHAGCSWPACLHWGLRRGEIYLDPLSLIRRGPVRLLPLHEPTAGAGGQLGPPAPALPVSRWSAGTRPGPSPRSPPASRASGAAASADRRARDRYWSATLRRATASNHARGCSGSRSRLVQAA